MNNDTPNSRDSLGNSQAPNSGPDFVDRRKRRWLRKLYRVFFWGLIDLDFKTLTRRILQLEIIGFAGIIMVSWANETFDLPHLLYNAPESTANYYECAIESAWALLVMIFVLSITQVFLKQIRHLEGFLPVCSFCKSIRVDDEWVSLEEYMQKHSRVTMTHSLCPPCAKKHYGYDEEEQPDGKIQAV